MRLFKTSEKIIIWLHRNGQTQSWLANELEQTRAAVSQKISENMFTASDLVKMKKLGFNDEE